MASDSIFLLQGPPGTGKTQVIAELSAQLARSGKKVLISSETHKAIDNVFDRLPKIPEIRPVRLIPSYMDKSKENEYSIDSLLLNFYKNITVQIDKQIKKYDNFNEYKDNFDEKRKELKALNTNVLYLEKEYKLVSLKIKKSEENIQGLKLKISQFDEEINAYKVKLSNQKYVEKQLHRLKLETIEEDELGLISELRMKIQELFQKNNTFNQEREEFIIAYNCDVDDIEKKINELNKVRKIEHPEVREKKNRRDELRKMMNSLRDDYDDIIEGKEEEFNRYRVELNSLKKEIEQLEMDNLQDKRVSELEKELKEELEKFINIDIFKNGISIEIISNIKNDILKFKKEVKQELEKTENILQNYIEKLELEKIRIENEKLGYKQKKDREEENLEELREDSSYADYVRQNRRLQDKINCFFKELNITKEYNPENRQEAITIIEEEWNEVEKNFNENKRENEIKIPMYKRISTYLSKEIEEEEKKVYTKYLYDNANIFGMTCTASNRFNNNTLDDLSVYNIGNIDIKNIGIDVVIVDEVSKSSFLDLLIPILYGKTTILVGDHRQLPPMYDLKHLKKDEFEDLDDEIIDYKLNIEFTKLYEECFFKNLFEKIPSAYKIMLNKQYRCHSQIMNVFNCFYGEKNEGLHIGEKNQDEKKQHNLYVNINNKNIITPEKHVYFIDCNGKEFQQDGSTSIFNEQEAKVVFKLLEEIDIAAKQRENRFKQNNDEKKPEALSIGVICTYGAQAGHIKKKRFRPKYLQNSRGEERFIISTVDDFQGDERDIIIVSMVRNPEDKNARAEFIKQFERINVALSRARCLLIIVGSKKFLMNKSIDLPDLNGNKEKDKQNYLVYKEIIDYIEIDGNGYISAADILGGEQNEWKC